MIRRKNEISEVTYNKKLQYIKTRIKMIELYTTCTCTCACACMRAYLPLGVNAAPVLVPILFCALK